VTTSQSAFSLTGSGFGSAEGVTCSGSATGSSGIAETPTAFVASGPISGLVHCVFDDGSQETFTITGQFSANAPK
jgi:hypothetical protein